MPITHQLFGKLFRCELCGKQAQSEWLKQVSRLSPEMLTWRVDDFQDRDRFKEAVKAIDDSLDTGYGWITLSGPPGTGKTFLLAAIANEARLDGKSAIYVTTADLLSDLRDTYDPRSKVAYSSLFNSVLGARVLCLDELEKFRTTEWAEEQFFRLVDQRYREWDQGLTVLATNRRIDKGTQILDDTLHPGYLESRIQDGRFVQCEQFWQVSDARPALRRG